MTTLTKTFKVHMKNKHRRGRRNNAKKFSKSLRFLGINAAGLRPKLLTFEKVLKDLKPSVFFIEETKFKDAGKVKFDNYLLFEKPRRNRINGGGVLIGCIEELNPVWVNEGNNDVEALSIDIFVKKMKIRCCVAYGFQENDDNEKKEEFWNYLDGEVHSAKQSGAGLVIQFDGNLWAGKKIIPNDPRIQNRNGRLFEQFLTRNKHLTVVNSLEICEGLITRRRFRNGSLEESILDFFIVCDQVLPHVTKMVIDEKKKHVLTNYENVKTGRKATDTDHNTQFIDLDLKILTEKPVRHVVWNFKNKESQKAFRKETSETKAFTDCFKNELDLGKQIKNWKNVLIASCNKSFKKIRITKTRKAKNISPEASKLINIRNELSHYKDNEKEVEALDEKISDIEAEMNRNKIVKNFQELSQNPENVNLGKVWKCLNKIWPKYANSLPTAKMNYDGRLISSPKELKKLLAKEYKERLRTRPLRSDMSHLKIKKKRIFQMKLKLAEKNKSKLWTMADLELALRDLKTNKSRDPEGFINEIFKNDVIGTNLKESMLLMFNALKKEKMIPKFMNKSYITTIPKKGSRLKLENERGIFRVSVFRNILMRMIYNQNYHKIDCNISDSQMGGRKSKGCRNNIFIVNGIIHDVMSSQKKEPVLLQIYDYRQMFDGIFLEEAISDVYDSGFNDDNLSLVYLANKQISMEVNTPNGRTEVQNIEDVVLQGDTFGSLLASVQVDRICQEIESTGLGYKHKNILSVSMLGLVDDLIGITPVGYKAQQMNEIINVKSAEKRLQFGVSKCKSMLISKKPELVQNSQLAVDTWSMKHVKNSSTGELELVENYEGKTNLDRTDKHKYLGFLLSSKGDNMVNITQLKNKSIGTIRKIFSKLESLKLRKYYFECGVIFLNVMLRSSLLYACETYYGLTESQIRQIERIEECFLRKLFKTTKGCPISQLYLELGHIPARFQIIKSRLLFLKYIQEQDPKSLIHKFLFLQFKHPTRGDWASSCLKDLKFLEIEKTIEEIKEMNRNKFICFLNEAIKTKAFEYLLKLRGKKGQEIKYSEMKMADYLTPSDTDLSITDKRYIFSIRNRMVDIPTNFPSKSKNNDEKCKKCGDLETMKHLYLCDLNKENKNVKYEEIFGENLRNMKKVYKNFKTNYENKEKLRVTNPRDPLCDPLYLCSEYSNGNI